MNGFLHEEHFCTFLLNNNDEIVAVGNPVLNSNIKRLYYNIISGKEILPKSSSQTLTSVSLSKDKVDMGDFPWKEKQEIEVTLFNTDKKHLVISDVITSCGCIVAEFNKKPINPHKFASIRITYEAEHPGHFDKTVTIYCNAKDSPLHLKVTGNAK